MIQERFLARWSKFHAVCMLLMIFLVAAQAAPLTLLALFGGTSFLVLLGGQRGLWTQNGHFGLANWVTLLRLMGSLGLLASFTPSKGAVAFALLLWFLDGIDGWLAVRLNLASPFGELFDKETDAFFTLALSTLLYCAAGVPAWILIAGGLRYGFVLTLALCGLKAIELAPVPLARPIGALALLGLIVGLSPLPASYRWVLAALTAALAISFGASLWIAFKRYAS